MPKPWEKYSGSAPQPQSAPAAPWERYGGKQPAPERSGGFLPISSTPDGGWQFDSNAGIVGTIKRAVMLPGDVYTGKVQMTDPETGRTSDEVIRRSTDLATVGTPVSPAMRAGQGAMGATITKRAKVEPPTHEALRQAGAEGFDQARNMPVKYRGDVVKAMSDRLSKELFDQGFDAGSAPKTFAVIGQRLSPDGGEVSVRDMLAARAALKNARMDFNNPTDKAAAEWLLKRIDKFLEAGHPQTVVAGTAPADAAMVGTLTREANANYAAGKRSQFLSGKSDHAALQAAAANSGRNIGNRIRSQAVAIISNPKLAKGFSKEELAAIREVAEGTATQNRLRDVGNLLGGGGGLGMLITGALGAGVGYGAGAPTAGALGAIAVGQGARATSNALTKRAMSQVDRATRMRSPLYEDMMKNAPISVGNVEGRAALVRALMATRPQHGGGR